jgi:orotate phosphoribosyltransferase
MTLKSIIGLSKEEILALTVADIGDRIISKEELFYTAKMLGAHWRYNYEAAKAGKIGLHALLKSLRHSDQFFVSKILLAHRNIREIIADQLVKIYYKHGGKKPGAITGIPDGATELGRDVARIMGVPYIEMEKADGKIRLVGKIEPGQTLLLIEDFCTRGTGFIESVKDILAQFPDAEIIRLELVILNRGGLNYIEVELDEGNMYFDIAALVTEKIDDWTENECELCKKFGSKPIKPKESEENWELINTAQL